MSELVDTIDWSVTTFEGSRKEQIRRAAQVPFDEILDAIEELAGLTQELARTGAPSDAPTLVAGKSSPD